MKKIACILIALLPIFYAVIAQDTTKKTKDTTIVIKDTTKTQTMQKDSGNTAASAPATVNKDCDCEPKIIEVTGGGKWFLIFSPFLLLVFVIIFIASIKEFSIKDALTENQPAKKTIPNPEYSSANLQTNAAIPNLSMVIPPTIEVSVDDTTYRPSISRYIALISSLITILLVVCMSSFFIYHYIRTVCPPSFGALTAVIIALGLGVTPYVTNKITTAATDNNAGKP